MNKHSEDVNVIRKEIVKTESNLQCRIINSAEELLLSGVSKFATMLFQVVEVFTTVSKVSSEGIEREVIKK